MIRRVGSLAFAVTFLLTLAWIARVGLYRKKNENSTLPDIQIYLSHY